MPKEIQQELSQASGESLIVKSMYLVLVHVWLLFTLALFHQAILMRGQLYRVVEKRQKISMTCWLWW